MTCGELIEKLQTFEREAEIRVLFDALDWRATVVDTYIEIDKVILIRTRKRGYPKPGPKPESSL